LAMPATTRRAGRIVSSPTDGASPTTTSLSLHDALPISAYREYGYMVDYVNPGVNEQAADLDWTKEFSHRVRTDTTGYLSDDPDLDRKSTRLNSSHVSISYAVFSLKKTRIRPTSS